MPKKSKPAKPAPADYYDMKGSVEKDKKVKPQEVFGKEATKKPNKKTKKKVPNGSHRMPDGTIMKDSDMKTKKKTTQKKY
tara:strand:- start:12 stop:251 length:240 start_codon:yes stop_codon:yes gene_type:complete